MQALCEYIKNTPKYKWEQENKAQIVTFENALYVRGGLYACISDFQKAICRVFVWCKQNNCKTIYFFINSSGGEKRVGFECLKRLKMYREIYKKLNIRVECIVVQYCCSAATFLALECDSVKLNNNAKMGIHYPLCVNYSEEHSDLKQTDGIIKGLTNDEKSLFDEFYQTKLRLDLETVQKLLVESKLLSSQQCLEYNLASEVIDSLPVQFKQIMQQVK
jgi:ATP-dependent protease ClpP protease subunit